MKLTFDFSGQKELNKKLKQLVDAVGYEQVGGICLEQAEKVKAVGESNTPVGPTGNLKRAWVAKLLPDYPPVAIVKMDFKIAPHAWLVEYWRHANPYFRPTIDSMAGKVRHDLIDDIKENLEKAI